MNAMTTSGLYLWAVAATICLANSAQGSTMTLPPSLSSSPSTTTLSPSLLQSPSQSLSPSQSPPPLQSPLHPPSRSPSLLSSPSPPPLLLISPSSQTSPSPSPPPLLSPSSQPSPSPSPSPSHSPSPLPLLSPSPSPSSSPPPLLSASSQPSPSPSPSPPSLLSPSPLAVGLHGYRRYHANDSLVGRPVPCTYEEKLCFRLNLYYVSHEHKCSWFYFPVGNREEFWHMSGHLTLLDNNIHDYCPGIRMAYDSICYKSQMVYERICGCNQTSSHILGGRECRCSPSSIINVEQPKEEGRCKIPNLQVPIGASHFFRSVFEDIQGFRSTGRTASEPFPQFACSAEQAQCFSVGKVWVAEGKGCFSLREKGPCAEDHVVALDAQAAREGRAEATCVHVRLGCPEGHVRMAFDGQCHSEYDLSIILPFGKDMNQFGIFFATDCGYREIIFIPERTSGVDGSSTCSVKVKNYSNSCGHGTYIPCHSKSGCSRYEVISEPPKPEE